MAEAYAGRQGVLTYDAILTQAGTAAPVVVALSPQNTLSGIVWSRAALGSYKGTLQGAFPDWRVFGRADLPNSTARLAIAGEWDRNAVVVSTYNIAGAAVDAGGQINVHIEVWQN